ncbi:MAG: hypothetical protein NVS2B17_01800 [Candidatus Velthaea sp.]
MDDPRDAGAGQAALERARQRAPEAGQMRIGHDANDSHITLVSNVRPITLATGTVTGSGEVSRVESGDGARARRAQAPTAKIRLHDDHDAIDRTYWRSVPPDERVLLCWEFFVTQCLQMGIDADQLRLRRSVTRIQRGRR